MTDIVIHKLMNKNTQKILKIISIAVVLFFVIPFVFYFFFEENLKVELILLLSMGIVFLLYAYQMARKEDFTALKTIFTLFAISKLIDLISRII